MSTITKEAFTLPKSGGVSMNECPFIYTGTAEERRWKIERTYCKERSLVIELKGNEHDRAKRNTRSWRWSGRE